MLLLASCAGLAAADEPRTLIVSPETFRKIEAEKAAPASPATDQHTIDSNRPLFQSLYQRALLDNPKLAGRVTFELLIARSGEVTSCRITASTLQAPELESRLCERARLLIFKERQAPSLSAPSLEFPQSAN